MAIEWFLVEVCALINRRVIEFKAAVFKISQFAPVLATSVFNYLRLNAYSYEFAYK